MCLSCWKSYGRPSVLNNAVIEAAGLIRTVYEHHAAGGNLHVVLDDWNIEDEHLQILSVREGTSRAQREAESICLAAMRRLSLAERATALAIVDGLILRPTREAVC